MKKLIKPSKKNTKAVLYGETNGKAIVCICN